MRHALWALVVATLISVPSQAVAQNWKEHRPEGAGYVVEMPGQPKVSWQEEPARIGAIKTYRAGLQVGRIAFVTMFTRYPEKYVLHRMAADSILDAGRDGAVANGKGKLRAERRLTVSGFPGREIVIDTPNGLVTTARFFLSGNTVIQAIASGPAGAETNVDVRRFLDSLRSTAAK